jgi:hypothetical protein
MENMRFYVEGHNVILDRQSANEHVVYKSSHDVHEELRIHGESK